MANNITDVAAENAPLGVLLWSVRSPEYADNFTLDRVDSTTIRTEDGTHTYVTWHYRSGDTRTFDLGEPVAVKIGG